MGGFAGYLSYIRKQAGFASLGEAARAAKKLAKAGSQLSKARLSLYERGQVETLKPEVLELLARLYQVPYEELAQRWFSDRYRLQLPAYPQPRQNRKSENAEYLLQDPESAERLGLISVKAFQEIQAKLPVGTQVGVAALKFLDDTIYFDMVSKNIQRGISYYYLLPESQRVTYDNLLSKVGVKYPALKGDLDGTRTFFVPRLSHSTPVNEVIFIYPTGEVQGFMGLLSDDQPIFFQVLKDRLAMRVFNSFTWMLSAGNDKKLQACLRALEQNIQSNPKPRLRF